jgi:hypothetical protein
MLTLFGIPKPFAGHIGVIQRNAIASWARLGAGCEVLLFGDEEGTAEVAREHGIRHLPEVARNQRGTPLISDLFARAARLASQPVLAYANADMILTSDLPAAVARVRERRRFLLCGRRWNLTVSTPFDFSAGWEERLRTAAAQEGELAVPGAIDYFAFPRSLFDAIPAFAVGRVAWDQWLLYRARYLGAALIDATACVLAVHQNHDYAHLASAPRAEVEREADENRSLSLFHRLDLRDATHTLTPSGLRRALDGAHLTRRLLALPKFYLPTSPTVHALYAFWRRRVRGIHAHGGLPS